MTPHDLADPGRRHWLQQAGQGLGTACALALPGAASLADGVRGEAPQGSDQPFASSLRLAAAWRGPRPGDPHQVGILQVPRDGPSLHLASRVTVPTRAHGLLALPDGGFVAVAFRPGHWLMRLDAEGRPIAQGGLDPAGALHFSGHVVVDAAGNWLIATATDTHTGEGWLCVHDASTLRLQARLRSGGVEPHQLLLDPEGRLLVAHGGLRRWPDGRRRNEHPVAASLDRIDLATGRRSGHWQLRDPDLSIRHLAFATGSGSAKTRGLALALQAEHADPDHRRLAPLLARWDGAALEAEPGTGSLGGVAGDIACAGESGHLVSHSQVGAAWRVGAPEDPQVQTVARLREAGALAAVDAGREGLDADAFGGVWIASAAGLARWHPHAAPRLLAWPEPLAPDNHMAALVHA